MRFQQNPLITPKDIKPSQSDLEVCCVLNPGVARFNDQTILLLRVCERPLQEEGWLSVPVLEKEAGRYKILRFKKDDPLLDFRDPRIFDYGENVYLTTASHLRIARSNDGVNFTIEPKPFIFSNSDDEEFGVEDSRITKIEDTYYIYYVAVSRNSYCTKLASTKDFKNAQKHEIIFHPQNKDVAIFEGKIGDSYIAFHRPDLSIFRAPPAMWLAYSKDLIYWGRHKLLISPRKKMWDSARIGAGTVPILTDKGWLEIYHGANEKHNYSLGLLLLDALDPSKIIYRSDEPFFEPQEEYE
ncbi:MAG: glycosidase, partial [Phycisphaerales bacterium]